MSAQPPRPAPTLDDFRDALAAMNASEVSQVFVMILVSPSPSPEVERGGVIKPITWLAGAELAARVERFLIILDAMTPADRRSLASVDAESLRRIAVAAVASETEVAELIACYHHSIPWLRMGAESLRGLPFMPGAIAYVRGPRLDGPRLSAEDRESLWGSWERSARDGKAPGHADPWFPAWDREVRLWDFCLDA